MYFSCWFRFWRRIVWNDGRNISAIERRILTMRWRCRRDLWWWGTCRCPGDWVGCGVVAVDSKPLGLWNLRWCSLLRSLGCGYLCKLWCCLRMSEPGASSRSVVVYVDLFSCFFRSERRAGSRREPGEQKAWRKKPVAFATTPFGATCVKPVLVANKQENRDTGTETEWDEVTGWDEI